MTNTRPLRFRLFLLAASGLVPLAIAALCAALYLVHERQVQATRSALEVSRALASAVDAELRATAGVLQSIADAAELAPDRIARFHDVAAGIAASRGWRSIVLADPTGKLLMSSSRPVAEANLRAVDPASMAEALQSTKPVVGRVVDGAAGRSAFAVRVPVQREGKLGYVLTAVVPVELIVNVVLRQNVPTGWVATVLDQEFTRVARSLQTEVREASPSLRALIETGGGQGIGETTTVEGTTNYTGFTRLAGGWTVVVGVSKAQVNRSLYPLLAAIGLGLVASLILSAGLTSLFTRGVSEPIDALKRSTAALGAGERVDLEPLGIAELEEVRDALIRAAEERDRLARERTEAQAERDALLGRVTEALRSAEDAGRSKDEFLAVLGHELRNPLAPISNALHLINRKGDPGTVLERRIIERQLGHMKRLVDDLLDVSRITGKRLTMRMEPLQPGALVQQAAEAMRPLLHGRTLRVHVDPEAAGAWLSGDEVRLAQVLNNLLGNASKFTPPDGTIELLLRSVRGGVEIEVRDNGQGMAPEVLQRAFDVFYQAPQEADRARGGLGLGLAIVKSLVEMHGGTVRAESEGLGRGCRFVVWLPVIEQPVVTAAPEQASLPGGSARVLLVDDNEDAADTTGALLEAVGYEVRVAYEPAAALELLQKFKPDVAMLDIGLPGMSGYELARRMRAAGFGGTLVAMTGYGRETDVVNAMAASFDLHLTKPVAPDELLAAIANRPATKPPAQP